jgi:hypothetical protein
LDAYESKNDFWKSLKGVYGELGRHEILVFFNGLVDFLPMIKKEGIEKAFMFLMLKFISQKRNIDEKVRLENVKIWLKYFPDKKSILKEWSKNIDDVLG